MILPVYSLDVVLQKNYRHNDQSNLDCILIYHHAVVLIHSYQVVIVLIGNVVYLLMLDFLALNNMLHCVSVDDLLLIPRTLMSSFLALYRLLHCISVDDDLLMPRLMADSIYFLQVDDC